ncbi:MAG: hypothetical protein H0T71_06455 [Acidobacteria bacterium]|nr:hypothetical protein [Acidobacteriota bacterium]
MADFNIRSESVDVEQIMKQIRGRIQEKRGVDYTEEQIRELASVRLEKFLDPKNLRSDLLEQFRKSRPALPEPPQDPPPVEAPYAFDDQTLFHSHRSVLRLFRKLLKPVLKLFINPNTLNKILDKQAQFNIDLLKRDQRRRVELQRQVAGFERSRGEWNVLYYEILHNLVLETTRNGIELKNLKMRLESLTSRLDFSERRVRALEGVVQYRPEAVRPPRDRDRDRNPDRERNPDRDRNADRDRNSDRDRNPDREREGDRGRDRGERDRMRPPRPEPEMAAAEPVVEAALDPAAEGMPVAGAPTTLSDVRRRRRRRRGRRGAGIAATGAAQANGEDSADVELATADDFEGGDESFSEPDASEQAKPSEPPDPDQQ